MKKTIKKFYVEATQGSVPLNDIYDYPDSQVYVFESKEEALNFVCESIDRVCFLCAQIITKKEALKILERQNPLMWGCRYYRVQEIQSKFYDKQVTELIFTQIGRNTNE